MLQRVDRMQLAVRDRAIAADTLAEVLGAERVQEDDLRLFNATRTVVQAGESEFELLEPAADGPVASHLERWGVPLAQIEEMEWWQKKSLGGVEFVCTPTRHYSGRSLGDRSATLWSSWAVLGPRHRFFYSGDTGYGTHFHDIGARLGPFDLAFVKIGAYGPGASWIDIHMPPEQSVQAHQDVRARRMFPVHWSTFNLAYHDWDEPIRRTMNGRICGIFAFIAKSSALPASTSASGSTAYQYMSERL